MKAPPADQHAILKFSLERFACGTKSVACRTFSTEGKKLLLFFVFD
jgi:hypothetical protein